MNRTPSVFKPRPGEILYKAAVRAITIADDLNEEIVLDFSGTMIPVQPGDNVDKVLIAWGKEDLR